ncbi:regulatory particle triple-A ATPase 4A [Thalictrum thalictroides]|uniref:Regulatory particle triple-A ATPase 4A n=1 Tax=Thalictrum thalictroides TaxID=46969 RepID=A0A7J6X8F7_THATH|nr:regulatory particle triple-A ATPase 4A [Thalictrum thalictroides]
MAIFKIHAAGVAKLVEIDCEAVVKLAEAFNEAALWNVFTKTRMFGIFDERDYVIQVDLMKVTLMFNC